MEAFGDPHWKQPRWKDNLLYRTFGQDYIGMVFDIARAADPAAKLCLLDYQISWGMYGPSRAKPASRSWRRALLKSGSLFRCGKGILRAAGTSRQEESGPEIRANTMYFFLAGLGVWDHAKADMFFEIGQY